MIYDEKFGTIKGLSERRRLPLLGKIRLGIKVKNTKGVEYPKETDYFVCPLEVQKICGQNPKELEIMFPVVQRHIVFPQAYRYYGSSRGLKCIGNGEAAHRWSDDKKSMQEIECPCEHKDKECKQRAFLMVMIPSVSMGGVYQISTSSYNSIIDINSGLDYIEALIGRIQMIPLKLKRESIETHHDGKKQTHHTLKIVFNGNIDFINQLRENTKRIMLEYDKIALPAPQDENPEYDTVDTIEQNGIKDEEQEQRVEMIDEEQKLKLQELAKKLNLKKTRWNELIRKYKKDDYSGLTFAEAYDLINILDDCWKKTQEENELL